jgi:hypothetical protein
MPVDLALQASQCLPAPARRGIHHLRVVRGTPEFSEAATAAGVDPGTLLDECRPSDPLPVVLLS